MLSKDIIIVNISKFRIFIISCMQVFRWHFLLQQKTRIDKFRPLVYVQQKYHIHIHFIGSNSFITTQKHIHEYISAVLLVQFIPSSPFALPLSELKHTGLIQLCVFTRCCFQDFIQGLLERSLYLHQRPQHRMGLSRNASYRKIFCYFIYKYINISCVDIQRIISVCTDTSTIILRYSHSDFIKHQLKKWPVCDCKCEQ